MTWLLRGLTIAGLALLLWPEASRYRAERQLAEADTRLQQVLLGRERGAPAQASVAQAEQLARDAARHLSADPRAALLQGVALILQGRGADAIAVLDAAIAHGERPELTLNLGRARASLGDEAGADAAFLRTAWNSDVAIATLPRAMRLRLRDEVDAWDAALRMGERTAPPPLSIKAEPDPPKR